MSTTNKTKGKGNKEIDGNVSIGIEERFGGTCHSSELRASFI
jgi:hypothetical protein